MEAFPWITVSGPGRWVGIPCCVGEYEPEPTMALAVATEPCYGPVLRVWLSFRALQPHLELLKVGGWRNRLGVNVRIARCRWFDSVIFTLCTSVRVPELG